MTRIDLPARHHPRSIQDRHELAQKLRDIANALEANRGAVANTQTLVIFGTTPDGPWGWHTARTYDEMISHVGIVSDMGRWDRQTVADGDEPKTMTEVLRECWERRQRHEAQKEADRVQYLADHPWMCEFCDRRFKTERGAVQHERDCWRNPAARRYGPDGHYRPFIKEETGKIIGFALRGEDRDESP